MEELASALSADEWFEFKPLFLIVRANLRARDAAHGDADMLRLRAYDKLHTLVVQGIVEKDGPRYRGVGAALTEFRKHLAAEHCRDLLEAIHDGGSEPAH